MSIAVVTDSASDLPTAVAEELGIAVVPLTIRFGDEELVDRRDLTTHEFWERCARSPTLPGTAAPSPGAFQVAFEEAARAGATGVVCVTLSSALSATYEAAQAAARAAAPAIAVQVVDSRSITMGEGLMVIAGARLAAAGKPLDEVAAAVADLVGRTRVYGALATLDNLRKGGRIGAAAAMFGSLLSFKPIITVVDGAVEAESRQRTRARSLRYLVDKLGQHGRVEQLAVVHGEAPDVDELVSMAARAVPEADIVIGDLGPVIGAHAGPGAIGLTFQVSASQASSSGPSG